MVRLTCLICRSSLTIVLYVLLKKIPQLDSGGSGRLMQERSAREHAHLRESACERAHLRESARERAHLRESAREPSPAWRLLSADLPELRAGRLSCGPVSFRTAP